MFCSTNQQNLCSEQHIYSLSYNTCLCGSLLPQECYVQFGTAYSATRLFALCFVATRLYGCIVMANTLQYLVSMLYCILNTALIITVVKIFRVYIKPHNHFAESYPAASAIFLGMASLTSLSTEMEYRCTFMTAAESYPLLLKLLKSMEDTTL